MKWKPEELRTSCEVVTDENGKALVCTAQLVPKNQDTPDYMVQGIQRAQVVFRKDPNGKLYTKRHVAYGDLNQVRETERVIDYMIAKYTPKAMREL